MDGKGFVRLAFLFSGCCKQNGSEGGLPPHAGTRPEGVQLYIFPYVLTVVHNAHEGHGLDLVAFHLHSVILHLLLEFSIPTVVVAMTLASCACLFVWPAFLPTSPKLLIAHPGCQICISTDTGQQSASQEGHRVGVSLISLSLF